MPNPIAARWESSKLQLHPKTLHPLLTLPPPTKPQLSVPTPPGQTPRRWRVRGQSRKKKTLSRNVPTHKHGVRPGPPLSSTVILYKMFWARLCSPGPTQTTEFLIFLCVHPPPLPPPPLRPPPQLQSLWECFVQTQLCRARTVVRYIKSGEHGYEDHWPPSALKGLISTDRPALCPPRREGGMLFQSSPVHSDGWGSISLRVPTFLMIRVSFERFTTT